MTVCHDPLPAQQQLRMFGLLGPHRLARPDPDTGRRGQRRAAEEEGAQALGPEVAARVGVVAKAREDGTPERGRRRGRCRGLRGWWLLQASEPACWC